MAILGLDHYDRWFVIKTDEQLVYHTSKGPSLIFPGTVIGTRSSHDGKKIRCIIDDEINKVFTLTYDDFKTLIRNSVTIETAIRDHLMDNEIYDHLRHA